MSFDKKAYLEEMSAFVDNAINEIKAQLPDFEIFTISIYTDANAAISSINLEGKSHSDARIKESNEWSKEQREQYLAEGDTDMAELFEPVDRNTNPADFEYPDFLTIRNETFPEYWEEDSEGKCWKKLEPALKELGKSAFEKLRKLKLHEDFELSVNGQQDWYEFTWN